MHLLVLQNAVVVVEHWELKPVEERLVENFLVGWVLERVQEAVGSQ